MDGLHAPGTHSIGHPPIADNGALAADAVVCDAVSWEDDAEGGCDAVPAVAADSDDGTDDDETDDA